MRKIPRRNSEFCAKAQKRVTPRGESPSQNKKAVRGKHELHGGTSKGTRTPDSAVRGRRPNRQTMEAKSTLGQYIIFLNAAQLFFCLFLIFFIIKSNLPFIKNQPQRRFMPQKAIDWNCGVLRSFIQVPPQRQIAFTLCFLLYFRRKNATIIL